MGPGRGSAAGSIVAYCLKITNIDPIHYNLLFERFLNPERVSMPDIDVDFCFERRQEVIDYVGRKYGNDKVVQIVTFGTLAAKGVIRDVGRVMDLPYAFVDSIAKMVPNELNITLNKALEMNPEFRKLYQEDEQVHHLIDMCKRLEGLPRHTSMHAAGVVICQKSADEFVPLSRGSDGSIVTQFTMTTLEELGLLKMDFLGLRTLTVIHDAVKFIENTTGRHIDVDAIDYNDPKVLASIGTGRTEGVFQLESGGMKSFMKELRPQNLEDVVAGISLYRPGPMDFIPKYIQGKNHPDAVTYACPQLEPILKPTYGCIVYQEQVMSICVNLGHMEWGESDKVMKMMKGTQMTERAQKERNELFEQLKSHFIEGAREEKIKRKEAEEIFEKMVTYTFNKGHATGYSLISVQLMYYKVYYPELFWYVSMKYASTESDEWKYKCLAVSEGNLILTPHINGTNKYSLVKIDGENCIMEGLSSIKNVGIKAAESIEEERKLNGPYKDRDDFDDRLPKRIINVRVRKALEDAGALYFDKKRYFDFVEKYNLSIASR